MAHNEILKWAIWYGHFWADLQKLETILNELKVSILTKIALDAEFQKSVQF